MNNGSRANDIYVHNDGNNMYSMCCEQRLLCKMILEVQPLEQQVLVVDVLVGNLGQVHLVLRLLHGSAP